MFARVRVIVLPALTTNGLLGTVATDRRPTRRGPISRKESVDGRRNSGSSREGCSHFPDAIHERAEANSLAALL